MKALHHVPIVVVLLLLTGACGSSKTVADEDLTDYDPQLIKSARVFVDGKEKAVTPATINIRRSFGEMDVSLVSGGKTVRRFELERTYTSEAGELEYSYFGDESGPVTQFDVSALSRTRKGAFIIPNMGQPIQIDDREYGLTLLVVN